MNKIIAKKYYRIIFELQSPLSIGSGVNNETDSDIMVDSNGTPYIPGSSMAGVYRSILKSEEAEEYFGKMLVSTNEIDESSVITYDGVLRDKSSKKIYIGKRDMVALDEYKVAKDGAKFDFQILEPGVTMVTYIEVNSNENEQNINAMDQILYIWSTIGISFGAKTKRGYGLTKAVEIKEANFDFLNSDSKEAWINFDLYNENDTSWTAYAVDGDKYRCDELTQDVEIRLLLKQLGGLSIREYSTRVGEADYEQMKLNNSSENKVTTAVIPGTTWAGAFRSQMKKLGMSENELKDIFGTVKKNGKSSNDTIGHQSRISFSESYINDGVDIVYSRNAIDRFSGGTVDGALYTESTRYNGNTELVIKIDKDYIEEVSSYLAASIMDLAAGYMSVGGLTAVGRGLFDVTGCSINGSDINIDYTRIKEALA